MRTLYDFLGSLTMAVLLLVSLGTALALGTWCEATYGTPAAQHFFYHAIWFQILLLFLAVTLVFSALHRLPWQRHHVGFVMTHLGIILILIGNLIGIWFSVDGNILIPEGESRDSLELGRDVLWVQPQNPGTPFTFDLDFSARPWVHEVSRSFSIDLKEKRLKVTVDRYLPNASVEEKVAVGEEEFPAIRLELTAAGQDPEETWLLSRDPERFGIRWGPAHILFFEVQREEELVALEHPDPRPEGDAKGVLRLDFADSKEVREIPVGPSLGQTFRLEGLPYTLSLKEYFPDFIITKEGPATRSEEPQNPALAFTLQGPEGEDAFLVFALHPEFEERHGVQRAIHVHATYEAQTTLPPLPPSLFAVVRSPKEWRVVMTSQGGNERKVLPFTLNETYHHPWLDLSFRIVESVPKARLVEEFHPKDNDVRQQAIHVVLERDRERQEGWVAHGGMGHFVLADETVVLSYQPARGRLPFSIKLLDFRKQEYPGTSVASTFESDLEIEDGQRGLRLRKTISMNHPLTYSGYTLFQSSYVEGPTEATVLSVRKDTGTPVVYAGFIVVVVGILLLFYLRTSGSKEGRKG